MKIFFADYYEKKCDENLLLIIFLNFYGINSGFLNTDLLYLLIEQIYAFILLTWSFLYWLLNILRKKMLMNYSDNG